MDRASITSCERTGIRDSMGIGNSLAGLRVVEAASFIAAPVCCLTLAQMGADVIRLDQIGGGPDYDRWPLSRAGHSFYWEGLNKGKRSVAVDFRSGEGRELVASIITSGSDAPANFVTNFPADGFLSHEALSLERKDLLTVRITGWADGRSAFDYTVNAALGFPFQTGPCDLPENAPVNSPMPAWDFITGHYAAAAFLASHRSRELSGIGSEVRVPLGNIGLAVASQLGQIAEVSESGLDRPRLGNDVFGTFGRDFETSDGRKVLIVAITSPQWRDLIRALDLEANVEALETSLNLNFTTSGEARFLHRAKLFSLVGKAVLSLSFESLSERFAETRVCWGPYNRMTEILDDPSLASLENPLFTMIKHPSGHTYPTAGTPAFTVGSEMNSARPAPVLGADTEDVLSELLGLSQRQIGGLVDRKIILCG